ncbi:hypothetical protein ACFL41_02065 [Gemmatimonadota bacterium]
MNRRFAFLVAILGGFFIAVGAFQVWSGSTQDTPFNVIGILIFTGGWLLGWIGLFGITTLVLHRRKERMDALEPDTPPEADHEG